MLHIWLPSQHSELYVWSDTSNIWQSHDSWQSIADDFGKASACLYFPSRNILQVDSDLTATQLKQLGEAGKKYLFEDMSLSSVEQLQVRQMQSSGHQYLYAVNENDIEQWLQSASLVGMDIQALLPDFLLLTMIDDEIGQAHLYHDDKTTLLRQSEAKGTAVSFLPLIVEQIDLVNELVVHNSIHSNSDITEITDTLTSLNVLYSITKNTLQPVTNPNRHRLNYLIKTSKSNLSPYIKVTLMVAFLALFTQIIADGLSLTMLKKTNKATIIATQKQFKFWYPEERLNIRTSLKAQLEPKLKASGQNDIGMMSLFSQVSPLIKQSTLTAKNVLIDKDSINLELQASNRNQLDSFVSKLQQQGIEAELGSLNKLTTTKKVMGKVTIRSAIQN